MSYPKPGPALSGLHQPSVASDAVRLLDASNVPVDVQYFADAGWVLEVRYDEASAVRRQPFTGEQESCKALPLACIEDDGWRISTGIETCHIAADGTVTLATNGKTYFRTTNSPFSRHETPVEISEYLQATEVEDFKERAAFITRGLSFASQMVRFSYPRPEGVVLGLPGQSGEINRNGYRFELYNTDDFNHLPSRKPLYQSWPILFHRDATGEGWVCVFHDNPCRTFVDLGEFWSDRVTFESVTGNTRVYVLHAATLPALCARLNTLLGKPLLPPAWAFGYQQCRWSYMNTTEVRSVAATLRKKDIPCDAMYFDIDYMNGFRVFTTDPKRFADLPQCIAQLRNDGFHTVGIMDPGVKVDDGYAAYDGLKQLGKYWKNPDGSDFIIVCWPGPALLPDFEDPAVREWWSERQKEWLDANPFDGVWNDMNEPATFDGGNPKLSTAVTERGSVIPTYNLYGFSMARASADGLRKVRPGKRPFVISRSGYPGLQRNAVIWHGDNHAWWEHMRWALDTAVQYSLAGCHYTGADIPGFNGNPPDDLALRFFQLGSLLPFFRGHSIFFSRYKEPYVFGRRYSALIRKAIIQRYSLLREWYSGFVHAQKTGLPPLQPVFDDKGQLARDHVLLFGKILAAPVMERGQTRKLVYLPAGDWYVLGKPNRRLKGGRWLSVRITDASLPMYVRAGSILTRNSVGKNAAETFAAPEETEVYLDADGKAEGFWYGDDGESLDDPSAQSMRLTWDGAVVIKKPL